MNATAMHQTVLFICILILFIKAVCKEPYYDIMTIIGSVAFGSMGYEAHISKNKSEKSKGGYDMLVASYLPLCYNLIRINWEREKMLSAIAVRQDLSRMIRLL